MCWRQPSCPAEGSHRSETNRPDQAGRRSGPARPARTRAGPRPRGDQLAVLGTRSATGATSAGRDRDRGRPAAGVDRRLLRPVDRGSRGGADRGDVGRGGRQVLSTVEVVAPVPAAESTQRLGLGVEGVDDGRAQQALVESGALGDRGDLPFPAGGGRLDDDGGGAAGRGDAVLGPPPAAGLRRRGAALDPAGQSDQSTNATHDDAGPD